MAYTTIMKYGDYEFSPVPKFSLEKEFLKAGDGTIFGNTYSFTLEGFLLPGLSPGPEPTASDTHFGSYSGVVNLQDEIRNAFKTEGELFTIVTSGSNGETFDTMRCYPRVASVAFAEDDQNWYLKSPYSITLEYDVDPIRSGDSLIDNTSGALGSGVDADSMLPYGRTFTGALSDPRVSPFVSDISESWDYEINDDSPYYNFDLGEDVTQTGLPSSPTDRAPYRLTVSHSISANGKRVYSSGNLVKPAWQQARDYILPLLGTGNADVGQSGVLNLCGTGFNFANHVRTVSVDELGGGYSVEESWVVFNTGDGIPGNATEDWTVSIDTTTDAGLTTVKIDGTVEGYETRSYGSLTGSQQCVGFVDDPSREYQVTETRYTAASGYFNVVKDRMLQRVRHIAGKPDSTVVSGILPINATPTSSSINHQPNAGSIQYSYAYNDRPSNHISGALSESISINDTHPTDVFAEIQVLGRRSGPVLQAIGTTTSSTRAISVEAIMKPATGVGVLDAGVSREGTATSLDAQWAYLINAEGDKVGIDYPYESGAITNTGSVAGGPRYHRDYTYGSGTVYNGGVGTHFFYNNPKPQVSNLINIFYFELLANGNKVFKSDDSETWDPKSGRYSRNVSFTYQRCIS